MHDIFKWIFVNSKWQTIELTFLKEDVNKTSASKECDICHYFLNYSFKFQPNVGNRCHDLLMMSTNLNDTAIWNIKNSDYCCIISLVSKNEAINLIANAEKRRSL